MKPPVLSSADQLAAFAARPNVPVARGSITVQFDGRGRISYSAAGHIIPLVIPIYDSVIARHHALQNPQPVAAYIPPAKPTGKIFYDDLPIMRNSACFRCHGSIRTSDHRHLHTADAGMQYVYVCPGCDTMHS